MSDPKGKAYRAVHYLRAVCSIFFMKEAMEAADKMDGGITGANIKAAMESKKDWVPAGLDGVCLPATWTTEDHRGINKVFVYRGDTVGGKQDMEQIFVSEIPRKPEWIGW
jgi:branched-chain amino acid transport system substrate-binding protein